MKKETQTPAPLTSSLSAGQSLRRQAEMLVLEKAPLEETDNMSPAEVKQTLHELRVHQVELEMQNEELRRAQEALDVSHARYLDLYDFAPVGYITLSEQGLILEANLTVVTLLGKPRSALVKQSISGFILKEDQNIYYLYRKLLFESGEPQECELRMVNKAGLPFWAHLTANLVQDDDGSPVCRVVLSDITEQKRAGEERERLEAQLQQARKMEAISTLTGGIAHDYNNLLAIIMGNLSMAREETAPHSHLSGFLDEAEQASLKARDLTHQLMTLSRGGYPMKELGSIESLLKEIPGQAQAHDGIDYTFSIQDDLWPVEFDSRQMHYAISNVLTNAVEAMPQGGDISIKAENQVVGNEDKDSESHLNKGKYVKISIKDEGRGIPKEHLSQIFDPYFSTKERGTQKGMGLGLTTAYAVIQKHGGHIVVNSTTGVGTTVTIYLPASERPESKAPGAQRKDVGPQSTIANQQSTIQRVLVMDDEEMLRNLAQKMLERLGYEVETVKDGAEAIETYKKHMDSGKPFDGVILDLTIKGGMGGAQAIKELIKIDPDVKAIVCSGYFNDPVLANYEEHGFRGAMAKPYQIADLEHVLKKVLR